MHKANILIVEDEKIIGLDIQHRLRSLNYNVIGLVRSGEEAIVFIRKNRPEIVLMDIMLAGKLDGIETSVIVKKEFQLPVIFTTSLSDEETVDRAKITEPFGYIVKPVNDRDLQIAIEMALYKHKLESERNLLLKKLQEQQEKINTLTGLIPICAGCKKIRDDSGFWHQVEEYIRNHSNAEFTHSLCPHCMKELYPELDED